MSERPLPIVPAWRWWTGFGAVVVIGLYMTVLAYQEGLPEIIQRIPQSDKMVHFAMGGSLVFFLDGALRRRTAFTIDRRAIPLAALTVLVPAGIEEVLQRYSVHRTSSIWDFLADLFGVLVFLPLSRRFAR